MCALLAPLQNCNECCQCQAVSAPQQLRELPKSCYGMLLRPPEIFGGVHMHCRTAGWRGGFVTSK